MLNTTLDRMEGEWRARLEDSIAAVQAAQGGEAAATRDAAALQYKLDVSEARVRIFEGEVSMLKAEVSRARAEVAEHATGGKALADEVVRLRSMLDIERSAHEQMYRLTEVKHKHEAEALSARSSTGLAHAGEEHRAELDRMRRVYTTAVQSRDESLAEWRSKYAAAELRAERAEALLREIDRQLVPAHGAAAASTMYARAAGASGLGPTGSPSGTSIPSAPASLYTSPVRSHSGGGTGPSVRQASAPTARLSPLRLL